MNKRKHVRNKSSKSERSERIMEGVGTSSSETNETLIPNKTEKDYTTGGGNCEGNGPSTSKNITMEGNHEAAVKSKVHYFPRKKGVRARRSKMANESVTFEAFEFAGSTKDMIGSQASARVSDESSNEENKITHSGESRVAGYIFMCSEKTKHDCYRYRVFGLPAKELEIVKRIKIGTKLYLFNINQKILYGIYCATSDGDKNLESDAFGGLYQSQVRYKIFRECVPLPEIVFSQAMKENYHGRKFDQELNDEQVRKLSSLFQSLPSPIRVPSHELNSNPRVLSGIEGQRNLPSVHGFGRVAAQAHLHRPYVRRFHPRRAVAQSKQPAQHPYLVAKHTALQSVKPHQLRLPGTGNLLQQYTGGIPPQRAVNQVTEPGQNPYTVAKHVAPQFAEPHQVRSPGTAILQHGPYGRCQIHRIGSYETNHTDKGVIVTDRQLHPAAYASGEGTASTQSQLSRQRQPWVKDGYAKDAHNHTSHPSKEMEGTAPGYDAEFGQAPQAFINTNLSASSYNFAPWYRRVM